jgi:hypothetical protein
MKVRSSVKAGLSSIWGYWGGLKPNHNESMRVRSNVKAGFSAGTTDNIYIDGWSQGGAGCHISTRP